MTAYTLTKHTNILDLTVAGGYSARASADTIDTAGFNFTQDCDNRYGLGANTSAVWGSLTINATKGGQLNFDGRYVRMIPFNTGSGTITLGTQITVGSATGYVIGIYASLITAPVTTAASGWIKVTGWNSVAFPTSGSYTQAGFTFTITGASIVGFIEVVGQEAGTINANRLGSVNITGEWYEVGTTNGTSNQTMQIPNNGLTCWHPGVFIEKTVGGGDFEFYPNAGVATTTGTEATRGKCVWIDNTGLVRIGNSGSATNGYTPATGLRVVIGNVFFNNAVTTLTANVIPNATIATRYDFTSSGGGVVNMDKCSMMWYASFSQPYSVQITNSGFSDAILLSECASPITWSKVGVGNKPTTALAISPLTMSLNYAGGTMTDCVWNHATHAAAANTITFTDIAGFTFTRNTLRANVIRGNASTFAVNATRAVNCDMIDCPVIQGAIQLTTCNDFNTSGLIYCDAVSGVTVTTYAMYVWSILTNTINCTFDGLTLPIANTPPYTALLNIGAAGCSNVKLRNIGTYASPLPLGSVTVFTGAVLSIVASAAATDLKVQRVYTANTRLNGIYYASSTAPDNSTTRVLFDNVFTDYADTADLSNMLNMKRRGIGGTPALTAATAIYGTHFFDCYTSTTAGRLAIIMNEPSSLTTSQVTLTGGAAFTSAGGLYMPTVGMTATFEMPEYIIGHTAFQNSAGIMAGGVATNHTYEYAIDLNNGAGWSTLTTASYTATSLATALSGITLSAVNGFKLRLKMTTGTANTTAITSFYLLTSSTTTTQAYQYPLDIVDVSITVKDASTLAAIQNARVRITTDVGGFVILEGLTNASGVLTGTTQYASHAITGTARRATVAGGTLYKAGSISGTTSSAGFSSTILLTSDE
jgi:hypothetical protein